MKEQLTLFDIDKMPPPSEGLILDRVEKEFYLNKKNFWRIDEVAPLLGLSPKEVKDRIANYYIDAIKIEGVIRIPYNSIINYVFYSEEWEEQRKEYERYIRYNGGAESPERLLQLGRFIYSPKLHY